MERLTESKAPDELARIGRKPFSWRRIFLEGSLLLALLLSSSWLVLR